MLFSLISSLFIIAFLGLKPAIATVHDYAPLMKDFPLNELLAATELDKVKSAVSGIFNHLRKIRSTKYPIQRALKLVEAISRDLSSQILKVSPASHCRLPPSQTIHLKWLQNINENVGLA